MSLQVKMHKDIFRYEEKIYFGLTARKAITTAPTLLVVVGILIGNFRYWHLDQDLLQYIILVIAVPPLSLGWIRLKEMPLEKYLSYFYRYHIRPQERFYRNEWIEVKPIERKNKKTKAQSEVEIYE